MHIVLTPAKACANLRANRDKIAAFHLTRDATKHCFYRYDCIDRQDLCCGVGATLDPDHLDELADEDNLMEPIDSLIGIERTIQIEAEDFTTKQQLQEDLELLQTVHDAVFEIPPDDAEALAAGRAKLNECIDGFLGTWSGR